ncbi:MAG: hypothetical protein HW420_280 [Candidatus Nitrosotenuis sp.]|nr:hypothetical protein [Candidatus Nitrosotenuis sp.]
MERIHINVSATDYDKTSKEITSILTLAEEMVHENDSFAVTDSEFAFGWHFYVVSVKSDMVQKFAEQKGEEFSRLRGKGLEKKFLSWLSGKMEQKNLKVKFAIKEEMESGKYGIF